MKVTTTTSTSTTVSQLVKCKFCVLILFTLFINKCTSQNSPAAVMLCPPITAPNNGYLKGNCLRPSTGDFCSLFCNQGYKLIPTGWGKKLQKDGSLELKCLPDGSWDLNKNSQDNIMATCHGPSECRKDVSKIKDGFSKGPCVTGYSGQVCSFTCRPGYKLNGPSGIVCLPSGKWNKDPPNCIMDEYNVGIKCSNLIYPKNGGVFLGSCVPGRLNQQCRLECANGYEYYSTLTNTNSVNINDRIFTCKSNGQWDKPPHIIECKKSN